MAEKTVLLKVLKKYGRLSFADQAALTQNDSEPEEEEDRCYNAPAQTQEKEKKQKKEKEKIVDAEVVEQSQPEEDDPYK